MLRLVVLPQKAVAQGITGRHDGTGRHMNIPRARHRDGIRFSGAVQYRARINAQPDTPICLIPEVSLMLWKQFFTPVKSYSVKEAAEFLTGKNPSDVTVLDVRQPGEYRQGHLPGARLVPMGELSDRLDELERDGPTLVYCAIGGRSRVAAQMLAGKGFKHVINMAGGFKDWESMQQGSGWTSTGDYTQGLELFPDDIDVRRALEVAWGMEAALEEFYRDMAARAREAGRETTAAMYDRLARFEVGHKAKIENRYAALAGSDAELEKKAAQVVEGGMTTEEYMQRSGIDPADPAHIAGFAMMMEAQAMDLYARAARSAADAGTAAFLEDMVQEEKSHMQQVGRLLDSLLEDQNHG
jgi:rhodanese-related sulfurtransferase/rubrerythrin